MSPDASWRIAVVQMTSAEDIERNLRRARELVTSAAREGASLAVLPENFAYLGDPAGRRAAAENVEEGGPIVRAMSETARACGIAIVCGSLPERSADPQRPYQTSVLIGREGTVIASYRKIHLYDVSLSTGERYCEPASMTPGDTVVDAAVDGLRLGLSICYDVRFPELYRSLSARDVDLICIPSSFTVTTGKDHWHVLLRARAMETQTYVAAAAQFGVSGSRSTYGKSLIADPWGDVVAQCSDGEGIAVATVSQEYARRVRASLPVLQHRRLGQ